jgi:hypothetical protein
MYRLLLNLIFFLLLRGVIFGFVAMLAFVVGCVLGLKLKFWLG